MTPEMGTGTTLIPAAPTLPSHLNPSGILGFRDPGVGHRENPDPSFLLIPQEAPSRPNPSGIPGFHDPGVGHRESFSKAPSHQPHPRDVAQNPGKEQKQGFGAGGEPEKGGIPGKAAGIAALTQPLEILLEGEDFPLVESPG